MISQKISSVRIGIFIVAFFLVLPLAKAQEIGLTTGHSPTTLAETITGNGVQIFNPVVTCADSAIGIFKIGNIPNFPLTEGVILSTGNIFDAEGPNNSQTTTTDWGTPGDSLIRVITGLPSFDACILEFDVVPVGDTLKFDFIFASEEYNEYVGTQFNDVFGFFISGPGIVGDPGLNGLKNIALIPGTNEYVGINTVNKGNPYTGFPPTNDEFFVGNAMSNNTDLQYDGWTKDLYAKAVVQPCDTFHLKLVIADVGDRKWDSSVFVEKIESNNISVSATTQGGIDDLIEGCNDGIITFTREPVSDQDFVVTYYLAGTATNGVDYPLIGSDPDPGAPKYITIPANEASASITIMPFNDGIDEGPETITVYVGNPFCEPTLQDSLTVFVLDSLPIAVEPPLAFICKGLETQLNVETPGNTFNWSPADFLDDPTSKNPITMPTEDITYTVTSSLMSCSSTITLDVFVSDMELIATPTHVLCGGVYDGAINLNISNGISPYTVQWSGPSGFTSTDQNISNLGPGIYIAHVTDREDCTQNITVEILETMSMEIEFTALEYVGGYHLSCFDSQDGQIIANVSFGTPPYSFEWDDDDNQTTQTATNLKAGTYNLTVTDANQCSQTQSITLIAPDAVSGSIVSKENILCKGDNTGISQVEGQGGNPPYSYVWNTIPPQYSDTGVNLKAGTYSVTVVDVNGCSGSIEVEISEPAAELSGIINTTSNSCFGEETGTASATITGGTQPYTYSWDIAPDSNGPTIEDVPAGNHLLTVTDNHGCTFTKLFVISQPLPLEIETVSQVNVSCNGEATGKIIVSAVGGNMGYTYTWDTNPEQTGNTASGLVVGNYTVTVTDSEGCETEKSFEITEPPVLEIDNIQITNPTCNSSTDGSLEISATGGTQPYSYTWNTVPPTQGNVLNEITAGTYELILEDANGCIVTETIEVTSPDALELHVDEVEHILCHGEDNGSITVSATGGTPNYTYSWDDPANQTNATATNLAAGTYTVTLTDDNGCIATKTITITQPDQSLQASINDWEGTICYDVNTGWATVVASGGSGSYSYSWDDAANQQTATATNLAAGTYHVTVTDNNGCESAVTTQVILDGPSNALTLTLTLSEYIGGANVMCAQDSTATISLNVSGGTAPYTYLWEMPDGTTPTTKDLEDLPPGVYTIIVTDDKGCEETETVEITAPQLIKITSQTTSSLCFGQPSGSIDVSINGGVPDYNVVWNGPSGFTSSDLSLTNLEGGVYYLTITDESGCVHEDAVTVTQPDDIEIEVDDLSDYDGYNLTCYNSADGEIYITTTGGTLPYWYQWNMPGNPNFSNQQNLINLKSGTYEVVITDDNGCIQNKFIDIVGPDTIKINFDISEYPNGFNISCADADDGAIEAVPSGGIGAFSYVWVGPSGYGPETGNPIQDLGPGLYNVLATDDNGCIAFGSVKLYAPNPFSIELETTEINGNNLSCESDNDGSIHLIVKGGRFPVTVQSVSWTGPNGFTSSDYILSNLEAGQYCVTVTDINDCEVSECVTLTQPAELEIDLDAVIQTHGYHLLCKSSTDGEITAQITGGTGGYNIVWSGPNNFSSTSLNLTGLGIGTYCLEITDANGCVKTDCITLTAPDALEIVTNDVVQPICNGSTTGSIDISALGGEPGYFYAWTGPNGFTDSGANISNLLAGTYCVEVTDNNLCTVEKCFTLTAPSEIDITLSAPTFQGGVHISCDGNNNASITSAISGGNAPYNYSWNGPNGFSSTLKDLENLSPGQYCLEVTDVNNCANQTCIDIAAPDVLTLTETITLPACGDGSLATIQTNVSGGTAPYTYNWNTGDETATVSVGEGTYEVQIIDANNCTASENYTITIPDAIEVIPLAQTKPGGHHLSCFESNDGSISIGIYGAVGTETISWTGPNGYTSSADDINGLEAGEYCVTVTDDNGCSSQACVTLTQPNDLSYTGEVQQPDCTDEENGSITVNISGGVPAYQIAWTGPNGFTATGNHITELETGQYCFTVTDHNGCTLNDCIIVNPPSDLDIILSPEITSNGLNIDCYGGHNGKITPTVTGGTGSYTYQWLGPDNYSSTDEVITQLYAGTYCLTITDENGCSEESCVTLTEPQSIDITLTAFEFATGYHTSCYEACDGSLEATLNGGTLPLTTTWAGPNGFTSQDLQISNLCAGIYTLTVEDGNGCTQETSFVITRPDEIEILIGSPTFGGGHNLACFDDNSGVIETEITGGNGNLTVVWTGPNGFTSNDLSLGNLEAGTYEITVTDQNNCSAQESITLLQPQESLLAAATAFEYESGTHISCKDAADGSISGNASGGVLPYIYHWNGPDGFESSEAEISDLEAGEYTLVVEDANSCVYTVNVILIEPAEELLAEAEITNEILCANEATGEIEVNAQGGSGNYEVTWTGPDDFTSTSMTINNLTAGNYTFTLEDQNGCTASEMIVLNQPEPMSATAEIIDAECQTATGIINLTVLQGTPPYSYAWNTGDDEATLENVKPGIYTVTVTDANLCTYTDEFEVEAQNTLVVEATVTNLSCFEDETGMISVVIANGSEPIEYAWTGPNGFTSASTNLFDLEAGTYTLISTDGKECEITHTYEVNQPDLLEIEPLESPVYNNGFNLSHFQAGDGIITKPVVNGGTKPYTYEWSSDIGYTSTSTNNQLNLMAGEYVLVVTDAHSCSDTAFVTLTEPIPLEIPNGISPNGDGFNDYLVVRGLDDYPANKLLIFNRWGNKVYEEKNYKNSDPWYGTNNHGDNLPDGTYYIVVELEGAKELKGYLEIRR